jgi:hypothetical protein
VLRAIEACEREIATLDSRLEARASEVSIEIGAAGIGKISLNEAMLTETIVRLATEPMRLQIGDLATIRIAPPEAESAADRKARADWELKLARHLAAVRAKCADEARNARESRERLEAEAGVIRAELALLGLSDTDPAPAIAALNADIAVLDAMIAEVRAEAGAGLLPSEAEIARDHDALQARRDALHAAREALSVELGDRNAALAGASDHRGRLSGSLAEIRNALLAARDALPDAERSARMEAAMHEVRAASEAHHARLQALDAARSRMPSAERLDALRAKVERLNQSIERRKILHEELALEIARLEGQIQAAGGDGLGERVNALRQGRDLAERDVQRLTHRVAVLTLLKETIAARYAERRDRLNAPLQRHLKPFLDDVFKGAEIDMGDRFAISGVRRGERPSEPFEQLSVGTQEQIAVLVRLAMGTMLADQGRPLPIILDDALVFSDDARIEAMFEALTRAGEVQQVIVLTCRMRSFERLKGERLSISS